jgi:hypothetical protein
MPGLVGIVVERPAMLCCCEGDERGVRLDFGLWVAARIFERKITSSAGW